MELNSGEDPIEELITTYYELNSTVVEEFDEEPSPLEFMRYVARNTPFVVRGAARDWEAFQKWDGDFLKATLDGQSVNVAVTPHGNADAPTPLNNGDAAPLTLSKPHEEDRPFGDFLDAVIRQSKEDLSAVEPKTSSGRKEEASNTSGNGGGDEVIYAQTQNDNLRNEYASLFALDHLPPSIPFAHIALEQQEPDALNLWIGNARAVTALHKDNYENIYVQLQGRKRFVLLPPLCQPCVNEKLLKSATYHRRSPAGGKPTPGGKDDLVLELDKDAQDVPFATWDPDSPDTNATPYSRLAQPMEIILEPGDMLYLPAMWYHKVAQFCTEQDEGFVLAVNFWYDMDFSGPLHPMSSFVRNMGLQACSSKSRRE